ncbi:hypothetical protein [Thioalkalivibrio sp. ALE19]|uniref:hypothetical protein n=1 Tax=Thioalkalivibrio sp. ALE19 TaxID=1266909 RepID=UPI0003FAAA17|nr:hypothetical protein [Thioalkalivibrio sp. ALE19]
MSCGCDTEVPDLCQQDWRTAQKAHRCADCHRAIRAGEQYLEYRTLLDGSWRIDRVCPHCDAVRAALASRLPCYCYLIGGLYADEGLPEYIADLRSAETGDAFAVLRLIVTGRRAKQNSPWTEHHRWRRKQPSR